MTAMAAESVQKWDAQGDLFWRFIHLKDGIIQVYGLYIYYGRLLCFLCCLLFLLGCCYGFRYGMNDVMMCFP